MRCSDIGPLDSDIMMIGEAPGQEEERVGKPFIGRAGNLLKSICVASGINFHQCYVTNISPERPPNNNFGYFYEDDKRNVPKASLRKCWFDLADKIVRLKPKVVVCLGEEPLRAVTNLRGIGAWRGTRIEAHGTKVIATYHPANILRQYSNRVIAEMDLSKALRESEGLVYQEPEIIISPTISDVLSWIRDAKYRGTRVAFDIETFGKLVRSISFAQRRKDGISAISIPLIRMISSSSVSFVSKGTMLKQVGGRSDINYWSKGDEEIVLQAIAGILENKRLEKVGQNSIGFDAPLIELNFGIKVFSHRMDLMHAWHVLYAALPKSLNFICAAITDHPNYWTQHEVSVDESEWRYNAMDSVVTLEASEKVDDELIDEGLDEFYYSHVHPLIVELQKMERRGVIFDKVAAKVMEKRLLEKLKGIQAQIDGIVGREINVASSKQIRDLLYGELKFPVIRHHKTKKPTADEDALQRLHAKYPDEAVLRLIVAHRKTLKLTSTYVNPKIDPDGRCRCSYNASGTITGRVASSKTIFGTGMDLHNIPKGYTAGSESTRHLYVAGEGNSFVIGDLKQAEAMVVAWILKSLGDPTVYDLYHNPSFDIHKWCAANFVYLIPEDQVTKTQRQQGGKLANHSGNYMAGPGVMERRALKEGYEGFTYAYCKGVLNRRIAGIPGLRIWWSSVEREIKDSRTLKTCFGRRLHFFGRLEGEELRSAVAFEPQSTVGDICNKMLPVLDKWNPVLTNQDEIVLEVKDADVNAAAQAMEEASKITLNLRPNVEPLIIPIEICVGKNWKDTEEWVS